MIVRLNGQVLKRYPSGKYSYRFTTSRPIRRLRAREGHWRSKRQPHTECSGSGNNPVERAGILVPGILWVWKEGPEAAAVKEHRYLRARDDGT